MQPSDIGSIRLQHRERVAWMERSDIPGLGDIVVRFHNPGVRTPDFGSLNPGYSLRAARAQLINSTFVPLWTILPSACASQLVRRTQPCDSLLLMRSGAGVPWMP